MTQALVDTNVLVRHLTRVPEDQAARATVFLKSANDLFCPDVVVAEVVFVLQKTYRMPRPVASQAVRSVVRSPEIEVHDIRLLLRALDLFGSHPIHYVDAYLVALGERDNIRKIVSFDRDFDKIPEIERVEP